VGENSLCDRQTTLWQSKPYTGDALIYGAWTKLTQHKNMHCGRMLPSTLQFNPSKKMDLAWPEPKEKQKIICVEGGEIMEENVLILILSLHSGGKLMSLNT